METIDVQSRSFVIRWLGGIQGDEIEYQVKPLKKSVKLDIYKKPRSSLYGNSPSAVHIAPDTKALLDYTTKSLNSRSSLAVPDTKSGGESVSSPQDPKRSLTLSNIQQQSQEIPLQERLNTTGFKLVKSVGIVAGNKRESGLLNVKDNDYYYAFVLDNTYSKNAKKKVLFSAAVVNQEETKSARSVRFPQSPALPPQASFVNLQKDDVLRVEQGRYLQGYLFKKRRKRHQGFKKRFFSLDYKYGTLFYHLNEKNQTCRGEIVIGISTVSANKKDRLIIIDSGMELWVLKAIDNSTWKIWVDALQSCLSQRALKKEDQTPKGKPEEPKRSEGLQLFNSTRPSRLNFDEDLSYNPLPDESYEEFALQLKLLQERVEQCKEESLLYASQQNNSKGHPLSRTSTASSFEEKNKEPAFSSTSDSGESLGSLLNPSSRPGHQLYQKLCDLELIVSRFVQQGHVLFKDHQQLSRQMRDHKATTLSLFSNDEYFDATENMERGVIMLDVDDTEANTNETLSSTMDSEHKLSVVAQREKSPLSESPAIRSSLREPPHTYRSPLQSRPSTHRGPSPEQIPIFTTTEAEDEHQYQQGMKKDLYPLPWKGQIKRRNDVRPQDTTPPSILSFMRKNVGKDLSSIAMPVTVNEPVTILQTVAEMFEYADLLTEAACHPEENSKCLQYVSAFAVSCLSIYRDKTRVLRKPFTPLLAETFELVREDLGYRLIAEKVSHKPLVLAFHAEHELWECCYTVSPVQKFWGKSMELNNEGTIHLKFKPSGLTFEWAQPTTMLKNLIAGERYVEPINELEIQSSNGGKATVAFKNTGMFGGRSEDLTINILSSKREKSQVTGKWTDSLRENETQRTIWKVGDLVPDSRKKYGFTVFTSNLNEITELEHGQLPPTDSRLRPDLRAYEEGRTDQAEKLKLKLEKDQRERRTRGEDVKPQFFKKTAKNEWQIIDGLQNYWEKRKRQDWTSITPLW
ncbi:ZYRO0D10758p [Zygosaccharomyces rouxii]|uniref:ZYRO0D10758p n=1 Tax=Zygosaccharomyces rouxii (strain ATCC 2623 / CBS 732 / NBRC 1130 / NCYC 568 / NRRL Y-229) TaxID=559307 RepID=C5DW01_ZYGRC|nr:uncharacterized protein ZYRO0D10758g [Zygosaccharomyces rouxii]KAH9200879.1 Oxysterol-binding protein-domain-containing protein [Zygosaccharomyces rouxii]CAR27970.1 ZYRO0D10758p [Zygosaccharomyces rouxii]